jgi:uncharacterized protein with NAD-binding domain and iron-sulfur cluster
VSSPSVVILGGGISGMSAAMALLDAGLGVTLVEAGPRCGGLPPPLIDPRSGAPLDLVAPLFPGGGAFAKWLAQLGASDRLLAGDLAPLTFLIPGLASALRASTLPAALRLPAGLMGLDALAPVDRARAAVGATLVRLGRPRATDSHSFYRWLRVAGQSSAAISRFWNPLCAMATGLAVEEVAAKVALPAVGNCLGTGAAGLRVAWARQGLEKLIVPLATDALKARGARILCGRAARRLVIAGDRAVAVELADGSSIAGDAVISALAPADLLGVLPESWAGRAPFEAIERLRFRPAASVHLFYDRDVMPVPVAVACHEDPLWLVARREGGVSAYPAAGTGAATLVREEAIARVDALLKMLLPAAKDAKLVHGLIGQQPGGVLLAAPGAEALRPGASTPVANLWLAGSWTGTGLPSGFDGAVASGLRAAASARASLALEGRKNNATPGNFGGREPVVADGAPAASFAAVHPDMGGR